MGFKSLVPKNKAKLDCSVSSNEEGIGEERGNDGGGGRESGGGEGEERSLFQN